MSSCFATLFKSQHFFVGVRGHNYQTRQWSYTWARAVCFSSAFEYLHPGTATVSVHFYSGYLLASMLRCAKLQLKAFRVH